MKKAIYTILILFLFSAFSFGQNSIGLVGGSIFEEEKFVKKDLYIADGKITFEKPGTLEKTINIENQYVIPPFGDAHTHSLYNPDTVEPDLEKNIKDGNFYIQVLTNPQKVVVPIKKKLENSPLEVLYANGGLTSTLGHPFFAFEPNAMGLTGGWWKYRDRLDEIKKSRLAENDGYWFFDSKKDVDEKWDEYISGKPDVVKIYLLDAENQSKIPVNEKAGFKGLLPEVAEYIVKKAHKAGLRVFAHVETANDLRLGLKIGVDGFAHLPGYSADWNDSPEAAEKYDPTEADFEKIAKKKIIVIPTLSLSELYSKKWKSDGTFEFDEERNKKVLKRQRRLVQMMLDKNVRIALGSDSSNGSIISELFYIHKNNLIGKQRLLKIATETTPQSMFPNRKLGKLENGFEASFLVLEANPLENFEAVKNINYRFKQGVPIKIE